MSAFRVLHLSDIHIGGTYINSEEIAYKIISDLEHNALCSIKCVLITGDIFEGQAIIEQTKLVKEAVIFFERVLEQINIVQEEHQLNKNDFIFVPGNHDIVRVDKLEDRWQKYNNFLVGFYGDIPDFYNIKNYTVVRAYDEEHIVFAGFNSCNIEKKVVFDKKVIESIKNIETKKMLEQGIAKNNLVELLQDEVTGEYDDYGEIPMSQIIDVQRKIKKFDGYNVVALFHHHFYLFPEVVQKYGDSSLVRNYTNLIQQLQYMNVKTVLHGHKHFDLERPLITDDYYKTTDSIIDIFAGGSVGKDGIAKHTFSVIDFYDEKDDIKLIQNKFIYNNESLAPIEKKQIPPENISDRIIKLTKLLKSNNNDSYQTYSEMAGKMNKTYKSCDEIVKWTSQAITGFKDAYRFLDNDYRNIIFLLYAINYRTLSYKNIRENESNSLQSYFNILEDFFNCHLNCPEFDVNIDDFHNIFRLKKLELVKESCDNLLDTSASKMTKQYLAFSMVGIFFTDLYLVLTEYADDFYNESIKYKVNIKLDQNKFHQDVPAPSIEIKSDSDRRSVYIQLLCNEATAYKIAVLFVKEFDLLINKFEDYFKLIGLKIYYLLPKIEKNNLNDTIDNYNFEAYIPTLIPLLTGDNIYPSKEVFARELIQNSIDAIAVREAKDKCDFYKIIDIEIGKDENSRFFFKVKDCGTGMDRFKIERYFTSIGRSFYSGDEYEELNIDYKPISNFGIGFLSSFMVCKEIDVKTKNFMLGSEGLKLHIPNYDGCFFIEREDNINVGTEIKLYLNDDVKSIQIINYIKEVMQDIKYDIHMKYDNEIGETINEIIPAYNIRKNNKDKTYRFFIPFIGEDHVLNIDWESKVKTDEYIKEYEYGLLIKLGYGYRHVNGNKRVLNSGILAAQSSLDDIFEVRDKREKYKHFHENYHLIIINFPSDWTQIDVSREKITSFSQNIKRYNNDNPKNTIQNKIAESLYNQLLNFLEYSKKNIINQTASYIQEIIYFAKSICSENDLKVYKDLSNIEYTVFAKITDDNIEYIIEHSNSEIHEDMCSLENGDFINRFNELTPQYAQILDIDKDSKLSCILIELEKVIYDDIRIGRTIDSNSILKYFFKRMNLEMKYTPNNALLLYTVYVIYEANTLKNNIRHRDNKHLCSAISNLVIYSSMISDIETKSNRIKVNIKDISQLFKN